MGARRATTAGVYGRVQTGIHGAYNAMQVLPTQRACMCRVRRYLRGPHERCRRCEASEPECIQCGKLFTGTNKVCPTCSSTERKCVECGASSKAAIRDAHRADGRESARMPPLPPDIPGPHPAVRPVSIRNNARDVPGQEECVQGSQIAAEIAGPVPPEVYRKLLAEGPCVYCGHRLTTSTMSGHCIAAVRSTSRTWFPRAADAIPARGTGC
jgi:hypothetical protein